MVTWSILNVYMCENISNIFSFPTVRFLNKPEYLDTNIKERKWEKIDDEWCRIITFQDGSEEKILGDNLAQKRFFSRNTIYFKQCYN